MPKKAVKKPWGGRFQGKTHPLVEAFTSSIEEDKEIARHDILGSIAHARALGRARVLKSSEVSLLVRGLTQLLLQAEKGKLILDPEYEDIHMNIEVRLEKRIGPVAGKLHTGRSRNDQVATDLRMYVKEKIRDSQDSIRKFQQILVKLADRHVRVVMPAYTHLQRAQPVLFAHHLLAYVEMLERDHLLLDHVYAVTDVLPLGSGAATGSGFAIDRKYLAQQLGFSKISANSLDAVSDRDFIVQWYTAASLIMMHLSRLSEELILWASAEFDFVELPDAFATGSSMMPQKKNPDVPEIVRGKSATVFGMLAASLTRMKSLPLAYNRDLQEEKPSLVQSVKIVKSSLEIFTALFARLKINAQNMRRAAEEHHIIATDFADFLAKRGVPFRKAHSIVGKLVREAHARGKAIHELPEALLGIDGKDVRAAVQARIDIDKSLRAKNLPGGTAPSQVRKALSAAKKRLGKI